MPTDETIECVDCGEAFVWTAGQQLFYERKGLFRPRRCAACREAKYEERARQQGRASTNAARSA